MSKEIKITIVIKKNDKADRKANAGAREEELQKIVMTHDSGATIMSTLLENGLVSGQFCGGRGTCGRCQIQYISPAPLPTAMERNSMEPEKLRQGYRLACMSRPKDNCVIRLAMSEERTVQILTRMIDVSGDSDSNSQSEQMPSSQGTSSQGTLQQDMLPKSTSLQSASHLSTIHQSPSNQKLSFPSQLSQNTSSQNQPSHSAFTQEKEDYMIAVDLGTTTIAMQLRGMDSGKVIDTYCEMNPQRSYGADVLSRIQASCAGADKKLQSAVWEVLRRGVEQFHNNKITHGMKNISCMCIAGNTTMVHLLMDYDVSRLGQSPFMPITLDLLEESWENMFPVYIAPGISTFVGGDIVAGLYALSMLPGQKTGKAKKVVTEQAETEQAVTEQAVPERAVTEQVVTDESTPAKNHQDSGKIKMLIDLGTNGEMAVTDGDRMIVTATAAGPAFEGGASAQVIGTDMIALTAELLQTNVIEETGYMATSPCQVRGITITQKDIRDLQLAKAAVRAGTEILWQLLDKTGNREKILPQSPEQPETEQTRTEQAYGLQRVYLAGGFGYYLDVEAAFSIGLLPDRMRGKVQAVGNTSLEGAYRLGRDFHKKVLLKEEIQEMLARIEHVNLAKQEAFDELYIKYMNF